MSLNAAQLEYLASKGLTLADAIALAKLADAPRSRSSGAERQARYRERLRNADSVTESVTSDVTSDALPPPNDIYSNPPPTPPVISNEMTSPVTSSDEGEESLKPEHVVAAWNETATRFGLPTVRKLTEQRRRALNARIRQHSIDEWTEAIAAIERNPWLHGQNDRGWRADFDFLLQPKSFTKLIEGGYDRV